MKEGWIYKKLGEVCEVISGQSPEGQYYNTEGNGTPFYQGKKDFSFKYIGEPTMWTTETTKIAEKDDLLMSVRAPVGDVNFATQRLCIGRGLAAIRTKGSVDKEYLFYFLVAKKDSIKGKEGVGFASINRKEIMDIDIQYPIKLSEQRSIVSRLDAAFAHIDELKANAEKQLKEARALFQKSLAKAMEPKEGWKKKNLNEIVDDRCPISYGIVQQGDHIEGGIPVVRPVDLNKKYVSLDNLKCTTPQISSSYKRTILRGDEILLSVRGTTGIVSIAKPELKGCNVNRGIVSLFFKDDICKDFIYYEMLSPFMQSVFAEKTTGSTLKQINIKDLRLIIFSYPPLSEQQRIVKRLDSLSAHIRELEENQKKIISECDALKQALLRKVFE